MQLRRLRKQQKKELLCDTVKKYQNLIKFRISSYTWSGLSERKKKFVWREEEKNEIASIAKIKKINFTSWKKLRDSML